MGFAYRKLKIRPKSDFLYRGPDLNRYARKGARDFKSLVSTNSTTPAGKEKGKIKKLKYTGNFYWIIAFYSIIRIFLFILLTFYFLLNSFSLFWRRRPDSNRRIKVLQTSPLATWVRRLIIDYYFKDHFYYGRIPSDYIGIADLSLSPPAGGYVA